jgi:hypothetical protein
MNDATLFHAMPPQCTNEHEGIPDEPSSRKSGGEGKPGVMEKRFYPALDFNRIRVVFSRLVMALIAASRFKARLRLAWASL